MDVEVVKQAAAGRWHEFFVSSGIPAEHLTGRSTEHPCPKCGGNTRFRLIDVDAGALFCSHCFSSNNGDGFAATAWWLGLDITNDFQEILKKVADFFGVKANTEKKKKSWKEKIQLLDWNDGIGSFWISGRPPITLEAIQEAGAVRAKLYDEVVIAFPIHGDKTIIGYSMYSAMPTGKITHKIFIDGKLEKVEKLKVKTLKDGGKSGFLGPAERAREAKYLIKAEGIPDMLAANSLLPKEWAAICNVAGAGEGPRPWILDLFQGKELGVVVHDCDRPGQKGAMPWSQGIARHTSVKNVVLPYPITEDHGRDLRDFLVDRGKESFLTLVDNTSEFEPEKDESGQVKKVEPPTDENDKKLINCLQDLGLDVLGETDEGVIHVYASSTRKVCRIPEIGKLNKPKLIQWTKNLARQYVTSDPDPESHQYKIFDVQHAIAWAAADRQIDPETFKGRGLWFVDGEVVAANGNHLSTWQDSRLISSDVPRVGDVIFRLAGARDNWFDQGELVELCESAKSPKWCESVFSRLEELFQRWTWVDEENAPLLVASLVAATFLQSAWRIRPQVGISGVSGCGKSDLMKFLFGEDDSMGIFGRLCWSSGDTSGSGLTQAVKQHSLAVAIDEWDKIKPRYKDELREIMRNMSSGQSRDRGSSHGTQRSEKLCHMMWFFGITLSMEEAADRNRVVQIGLLKKPGTDKWKNFVEPSENEAVTIGKELLAMSLLHGSRAARLSIEVEHAAISDSENSGIDSRLLRIMSVPATCYAIYQGKGAEHAANALKFFVEFALSDQEAEVVESHIDLLNSILEGQVQVGPGLTRTLSQILASYTDRASNGDLLESYGVRVIGAGDHKELVIHKVSRLLKDWSDRDARRMLTQIDGAYRLRTRIAGRIQRCTSIPWSALDIGFDSVENDF